MGISNFVMNLSMPNPVVTWDGDDDRSYELKPDGFTVSVGGADPVPAQPVTSAIAAGTSPQGMDAMCVIAEVAMGACMCIEQMTDDHCVLSLDSDVVTRLNQFAASIVGNLKGWLNDHLSVEEAKANSNQGITLIHSNDDDTLHVHLVQVYQFQGGTMMPNALETEVYASDSAVSPFDAGVTVCEQFTSENLSYAIHQAKEWADNDGVHAGP